MKYLNWTDYYKDLDIPKTWENISYSNDEFPSFSCKGYTIWINSPNKKEREENYLGIGYDNLDDYEDWIFVVTYTHDYGTVTHRDLLSSMDFKKVKEFVSKPDMECIKGIMLEQFNYQMDFEKWTDSTLLAFLRDLMEGKTEYCLDNNFPKELMTDFLKENNHE
tara:strand:- start:39 stop:530 length:492 start_codon:yes stop_codon:yes gene_type:complete